MDSSRISIIGFACLALTLSAHGAAPPSKPRLDLHGDPLPFHATARLGTVRFFDGGYIRSLAISRDGKTLASADSNRVRLWSFPQGRQIGSRSFKPNDEKGDSLFLFSSRDGLRVALWEGERVVIRDALNGKHVRTLPKDSPFPEAVSPDGRLAARRENRNDIIVWDFVTGKELHRLGREQLGFTPYTLAIAFTPDGNALASAESGRKRQAEVQFWDVKSGKPLRRLPAGPMMLPGGVAFSPDGKIMAVSVAMFHQVRRSTSERDYTLTLHDAVSGKIVKRLDEFGRFGEQVVFSPDGKKLAVGRHECIEVYDVTTGKPITPAGHKRDLRQIAFGPSSKQIVTLGDDETIRAWSLEGKPGAVVSLQEERPWNMSLSADGRRVAWIRDSKPVVRDLLSTKELVDIDLGNEVTRYVTLSPDGNALIVQSHPPDANRSDEKGKVLRRWDLKRNAVVQIPVTDEKSILYPLSGDGRILVFVSRTQVTIQHADRNRKPLSIVYEGTGITRASLSTDGRTLATLQYDGVITLWEVASGQKRVTVPMMHSGLDAGAYGPLAFSPDGSLLATGGSGPGTRYSFNGPLKDIDIRLWDVSTGKQVGHFRGHLDFVSALRFSPAGKMLVSGSYDHTALVWDVARAIGARRRTVPSADRRRACWDDLASDDATKAHRAVWDLSAAGRESVVLLWSRLRPATTPVVDRKRIEQWITDLDSDDQPTREKSTSALIEVGEVALPALREARRSLSLEVRRRANTILKTLESPVPTRETLRALRGVEVLERIGTDEARLLLRKLAGGERGARLTEEAEDALRRLDRHDALMRAWEENGRR